jgi:hypothetical protein
LVAYEAGIFVRTVDGFGRRDCREGWRESIYGSSLSLQRRNCSSRSQSGSIGCCGQA